MKRLANWFVAHKSATIWIVVITLIAAFALYGLPSVFYFLNTN